MNPPKRKSAVSGTGGITVFMVLAVLTVAVFSVLTMSSALADMRLSEKNADHTQVYYEAEGQAVRFVADVGAAAAAGTLDVEAIANKFWNDALAWDYEDEFGARFVGASFPVQGDRSFEIEVELLGAPGADGRLVRIVTWTIVPADFGEVISPQEIFN